MNLIISFIFDIYSSHFDKHIDRRFSIVIIDLLLGVYGDVHRVKILFNKKDSALIQFAAPQQAFVGMYKSIIEHRINSIILAHQNLDHITMFGKQIKVSFSKHQFVQMPKDGSAVRNEKFVFFSHIETSLRRIWV